MMKVYKIIIAISMLLSFGSVQAYACEKDEAANCSEAIENKAKADPSPHDGTGDKTHESVRAADTDGRSASIYPKSYIVPVGVCEQDLPPSQVIERE